MGGLKGNIALKIDTAPRSGTSSAPGTPRTPGGSAYPCTPGGTALTDKFAAIKRREKLKQEELNRAKEEQKRLEEDKQAMVEAKRLRKEAAADKKVALFTTSAVTGSNRGSVREAMRTLSSQLRVRFFSFNNVHNNNFFIFDSQT